VREKSRSQNNRGQSSIVDGPNTSPTLVRRCPGLKCGESCWVTGDARCCVRPQAEHEALDVRRWYEARREGLGNELGAEVDEMVARIAANPLAFQRVRGETRRGVLKRFPYAIYFRTTATEIIVLAIHGRQDPSRWQTRS
jgi:hypothetical protein